MSHKVYQLITERIMERLEEGVIPWKKPFQSGVAVNWKTQKPYRGINTMLLEPGEYATFKQIKEAGGKVKKGASSHLVVFWKCLEVEDEETGEEKTIPLLRYYRVFNIAEQVEGLEPKEERATYEHDPIEKAERIQKEFTPAPYYTETSGRAFYQPGTDRVNVPPKEDFADIHEYYSTLFHEMVHATA
ncbi:ArdC-like ssDNA-binding domain-containing protein [Salimicrobium halophilum]|uniref:ArdC-like ssDNA-binding domain-containing protein n=1 Tax=Salimicrobium halophilum TaxID=86666 RepID=UPI000A730EAE|nr:ArdC-like ssDNA-binding domain-containing protein [Salimicrobium halophilum]